MALDGGGEARILHVGVPSGIKTAGWQETASCMTQTTARRLVGRTGEPPLDSGNQELGLARRLHTALPTPSLLEPPMHSIKSLIASFVVAATALAQPVGEIVIRTRDGKSRQGRVLSETQNGYLFTTAKGTSVIPFESIIDLRSATAAQAATEARNAAVAPAVIDAPSPPMVAVAPEAREAVPAPPPPPPSVEASVSPRDNSASRGFHFGLGASAGGGRLGLDAGGQGVFDFNFGKTGLRLGLNLGVVVGYGASFLWSVDGLFHLNVSDVYTLGAGLQVGMMIGGLTAVFAGPVLQPVVIKLGDRGEHQLALTAAIGFGTLLEPRYGATIGYTYLF
jgi:hypothetical protein